MVLMDGPFPANRMNNGMLVRADGVSMGWYAVPMPRATPLKIRYVTTSLHYGPKLSMGYLTSGGRFDDGSEGIRLSGMFCWVVAYFGW